MMAEYIEREAALRALCEAVHAKDGNIPCRNQLVSCLWTGTRTQEYAEKILAIPSVDDIPIVRCKDCRYSIPYNDRWVLPKRTDWLWCNRYEDNRFPNWYCADGARKDGDGE